MLRYLRHGCGSSPGCGSRPSVGEVASCVHVTRPLPPAKLQLRQQRYQTCAPLFKVLEEFSGVLKLMQSCAVMTFSQGSISGVFR